MSRFISLCLLLTASPVFATPAPAKGAECSFQGRTHLFELVQEVGLVTLFETRITEDLVVRYRIRENHIRTYFYMEAVFHDEFSIGEGGVGPDFVDGSYPVLSLRAELRGEILLCAADTAHFAAK